MNYSDPQLRSILAGEYVLGTMPRRTHARFERLMRYDAGLVRLVGDWAERLGSIDETIIVDRSLPRPRVWAAIDARTRPRSIRETLRPRVPFARSLALWVVVAACLAVIFNLYESMPVSGPTLQPQVLAVLAGKDGQPGWIVTDDKRHNAIQVAAVSDQPIDAQHAFELWVIADSKPVPLGVIAATPDHRVSVPTASLPKNGVVFAVSLEPPGGSPTGQPTGPVLYQGKILKSL